MNFKCGHERTPENSAELWSHGRRYERCKLCRAAQNRALYEKKLLRKNAPRLAESLMRVRESLTPAADPERFMDKSDDEAPTLGRRSIGQMMGRERP